MVEEAMTEEATVEEGGSSGGSDGSGCPAAGQRHFRLLTVAIRRGDKAEENRNQAQTDSSDPLESSGSQLQHEVVIEAQTHCGTTLSCECIAGGLGGNGGEATTGLAVAFRRSWRLARAGLEGSHRVEPPTSSQLQPAVQRDAGVDGGRRTKSGHGRFSPRARWPLMRGGGEGGGMWRDR